MNAQVEERLRKMFAAYGRKPLKQQWDVYVDWAGKVRNKTVLQVIEKVIENEEKLPTIAKLQKETKAVTFEKRKKLIYARHEQTKPNSVTFILQRLSIWKFEKKDCLLS